VSISKGVLHGAVRTARKFEIVLALLLQLLPVLATRESVPTLRLLVLLLQRGRLVLQEFVSVQLCLSHCVQLNHLVAVGSLLNLATVNILHNLVLCLDDHVLPSVKAVVSGATRLAAGLLICINAAFP